MKTVTPVKTLPKVVEPFRSVERKVWRTADGDHLVTSSLFMWLPGTPLSPAVRVDETMVFPADADGNVTDWGELGISKSGDHEGALHAAEYEVI